MSDALPAGDNSADDLVNRAKTDRGAFASLYDRCYPTVWRYCLRRLFNQTTAEDVTSEVFLNVASHVQSFPGRTETEFRRWLFRIATNAVNAHLRQSRRRQDLWKSVARSRANCEQGSGSANAQIEMLDWPIVYRALLELDERDQTIVTLRFFADCSHDDIADIVESTPGAVRTALSRTLKELREKFNPAAPPAHAFGSFPQG